MLVHGLDAEVRREPNKKKQRARFRQVQEVASARPIHPGEAGRTARRGHQMAPQLGSPHVPQRPARDLWGQRHAPGGTGARARLQLSGCRRVREIRSLDLAGRGQKKPLILCDTGLHYGSPLPSRTREPTGSAHKFLVVGLGAGAGCSRGGGERTKTPRGCTHEVAHMHRCLPARP